MADYKELLRRAVQALPENNGQARRAVYEKARAALVGQLRAITPPLAARDITTHRLQLEDCIRQVEQEASEAVIAGMQEPSPPPPKLQTTQAPKLEARAPGKPQPAPAEPPPKPSSIEEIIAASEITAPEPQPVAVKATPVLKVAAKSDGKPTGKPDVRIAAKSDGKAPDASEADTDEAAPTEAKPQGGRSNGRGGRPLPSIVARAEAARNKSGAAVPFTPTAKANENGRRAPVIEPRRESGPRLETSMRGQVAARQQMAEPLAYVEQPVVATAMSAVREVEVESEPETEVHASADPQGAIDRAIATLDRAARGDEQQHPAANGHAAEDEAEPEEEVVPAAVVPPAKRSFRDQPIRAERDRGGRNDRDRKGRSAAPRNEPRGRRDAATAAEGMFQRPPNESARGGVSPLAIFMVVFVVLLAGAGGAGYWAYQNEYISLDTMFPGSSAPVQQAVAPVGQTPGAVALAPEVASVTGPGNTAAGDPEIATAEPKLEERLTPEVAAPVAAVETAGLQPAPSATQALALAPESDVAKTEERLPDGAGAAASPQTEAAVAAIDPANLAGSQSLLLEASDSGATGAVPFSGTVDWSKGQDETGAPTLVARASIPARNLTIDLLIRKNSDPSLPASHLMEINFGVTETFIGGSVAGLPGVLLKNQELVQGAPLVGASARVVGNQFLFALSASPSDSAANSELLTSRKWMDLAVIYATGKRAIITLEKDDAAEELFREVFTAWGNTASASAGQ